MTEVLEKQLRIKSVIKKLNDVSMTPCHPFQSHQILWKSWHGVIETVWFDFFIADFYSQ